MVYEPVFENKFFKEQKRRYSNVFPNWLTKKSTEIDKLDGKVLEALDKVGIKSNFPITERKIRNILNKATLKNLRKYGGLKASLERLEGIGVIYKDREYGWRVD
jgi:hypothetical protein